MCAGLKESLATVRRLQHIYDKRRTTPGHTYIIYFFYLFIDGIDLILTKYNPFDSRSFNIYAFSRTLIDKLNIYIWFLLFILLKIGEEIDINDDFSERLHCIIIDEENSVFLPVEKVNLSEVGTFIHEHQVVLFAIHWKHWKHLFQSNKLIVNYI